MDEADNRMEADGKGLFIIRNGQKVAKYLRTTTPEVTAPREQE